MEPYTIVLNRILAEAARRRASDVHLSVGNVPHVRIDGRLVAVESEPVLEKETIAALAESLLPEADRARLEKERTVTVITVIGGHFRFKLSAYYQRGFLTLTLRPIPEAVPTLEQLGLPAAVGTFATLSHGLVIVAGSFGSGKSTTINALVEAVNRARAARIVTVERPIEVVHAARRALIEQREVGRDTPDFAKGVSALLNDDVDMAVIGDAGPEFNAVVGPALEAAASGRLVVWEIQAPSIIRVVEKIITAVPPALAATTRSLLADVLRGAIVQLLLPKTGGGQTAAAEILTSTAATAAAIREGRVEQLHTIMQTSATEGMVAMTTSIARLVAQGAVTREDALAAAPQREDLHLMIG